MTPQGPGFCSGLQESFAVEVLLLVARCLCVVPVEEALWDELNEEDQEVLDCLAGHTHTYTCDNIC